MRLVAARSLHQFSDVEQFDWLAVADVIETVRRIAGYWIG